VVGDDHERTLARNAGEIAAVDIEPEVEPVHRLGEEIPARRAVAILGVEPPQARLAGQLFDAVNHGLPPGGVLRGGVGERAGRGEKSHGRGLLLMNQLS
jgi:hypothetical protein